jgi:DNA modification methylase
MLDDHAEDHAEFERDLEKYGLPTDWDEAVYVITNAETIINQRKWRQGDMALAVSTGKYYGAHVLEDLAVATDIPLSTLKRRRWVAKRYEMFQRRTFLSWTHHEVVAARAPDRRAELLESADENHWSSDELKRQAHAASDEDDFARFGAAKKLQKKWGTAHGQVWLVGEHRVMCGDATNAEDVALLLDGAKPLLCVTDPPYGVNYDPAWRNRLNTSHCAGGRILNDDRVDWREAWALVPSDVIYVWHAGVFAGTVQTNIEDEGFKVQGQIIWTKLRLVISRGHYHSQHEPCWYAVRKGATAHWVGDRKQTTVWEIDRDPAVEGGFPTQKPVDCMARPMRNHKGDVYDPFLGSGTTVVAAQNEGRRCYGMELDPKNVAISLERLDRKGLEPKLDTSATQRRAKKAA